MSKKLVTVRNVSRRTIPLEGKGKNPSTTIMKNSTVTLGPEYHEHYHFRSLVKKRMLVVVREELDSPPQPKKNTVKAKKKAKAKKKKSKTASFLGSSSTPHHEDENKAQAEKSETMSDSPSALNADGK